MEKLPAPRTLSFYFYTLKSKWLRFWLSLNLPQKLYFSAIAFFIAMFFGEDDPNRAEQASPFEFFNSFEFKDGLFLFLILIALIIELWPKIVKFWEHTLGKALAFIFYAFLANYALANAAGIINDITGVNADHFPYTHNLSLMLSIPTWFMLSTFMVLVIIPLIQPFYILTLLLLRPFGLHKLWHAPDYRFPITTSLIRMFLCIILSLSLVMFTVSSGMAGGMNSLFKTVIQNFTSVDVQIGFKEYEEQTTNPDNPDSDPAVTELLKSPGLSVKTDNAAAAVDLAKESKKRVENYNHRIKQILAYFIYELEADSYSRCQITPGRRVIELNTWEILEIWPAEGQDKEYHFEVKPCISAGIGQPFKTTSL